MRAGKDDSAPARDFNAIARLAAASLPYESGLLSI
jgi:hypothetical protein